ncbi:MAG: PASTA domain-containing protein [Deltaproteobacteria bacterium]|nr:PASTA domain-containing protein [Deltaproteobacteria bacterium]
MREPTFRLVPDVVGLQERVARATLLSTTLAVGSVTESHSLSVPLGAVISQSPAAGQSVLESSEVALGISTGPVLIELRKSFRSTKHEAPIAIAVSDYARLRGGRRFRRGLSESVLRAVRAPRGARASCEAGSARRSSSSGDGLCAMSAQRSKS